MQSFKESLWANIHKKRKEGRPMRKPGSKGAPTDQDFKSARGESAEVNEISPEKKKAYKSKAKRDLPQRTKYANNYQNAAKADPSNADYKKRGDAHRRKEKNRMKGIASVTEKNCGCGKTPCETYGENYSEGFLDTFLGRNMKKGNVSKKKSKNSEQVKLSTEIDRKLRLIDDLMKKVRPLGGNLGRLMAFRKLPIDKMTPKGMYVALNDWWDSIEADLDDDSEDDNEKYAQSAEKLYDLWEEVGFKLSDYMWASGYNVKGIGQMAKIGFPAKKRTDPEWLKMNESVDEGFLDTMKQLVPGAKGKPAKGKPAKGKPAKKLNAEQVKISKQIDKKLKLIDNLVQKVRPLGGQISGLVRFSRLPLEKMNPKDLYRVLNDWYKSVEDELDYGDDSVVLSKKYGRSVENLHERMEELALKIKDYMYASGYDVPHGGAKFQNKWLNKVDFSAPKRTDAKWLKMNESVDEGFMDAILGKNMKKRDSGNAEQTKISTDINRKLTLIDGLMKKVKPLGGKMTRLTSFRKTPIEKMTPKDLYRALNDWYLSIDDYLNDNPEVDKRHGPTVVKLYSVWEEVSDKIQDYMWASGYNVERGKRGKRGAPNKMGNIIADVIKPGGPVMVQTKKLKVDGKLVDIDYNVPKRTDAKWLKMNESRVKNVVRGMGFKEASELDENKDIVWLSVYLDHKIMAIHTTEKAGRKYKVGGDGPDGHFLVKTTRKALGKRRVGQFVPRSIGKHLDNGPYPHDDGPHYSVHKESFELDEGIMDKMKQLVPGARNPQKPQQGKKTAMEMQFPYARLSVHRMIVALRKARGTAMKGKAQGKDRRENERSLGLILAHVEDIARNRHTEQPNSGRQIHDDGNIDDITQQYFMDKIRQNDWTKADQEILNAMVGNGTDDNTKGGAYHARSLAHDIALSVKYAKKDAGIKESRVKNVVRGMGIDPDNVIRGMGKGPHAAKDKARAAKEPKKTLKSRAKNVARGMGIDPDNVMRGMGFKESLELGESIYDKKLAQAWKKVKSLPNVRGISNAGQNHAKKLSSLLKGSPDKVTFEKLELALGTYEVHAYTAAEDKKNPHGKEDLAKLQEFCDSVDEVIGAMKNLHQSKLKESLEENYMACKDCGDEFAKPTTDCENDCYDENGSHWESVDEALSMQQRLARGRSARRNKQKMARGRERAKRKVATKDVLMKRARKAARKALYKKLTKNATDLSPARKKELETKLQKPQMQKVVHRLAKKLVPKIKKAETQRRSGSK